MSAPACPDCKRPVANVPFDFEDGECLGRGDVACLLAQLATERDRADRLARNALDANTNADALAERAHDAEALVERLANELDAAHPVTTDHGPCPTCRVLDEVRRWAR